MFCPKCGHQNPDGAKFCAGCGSPFAQRIATPTPAQAAPAAHAKPSGFPKPNLNVSTGFAPAIDIFGIGAAIAAVVALVFMFMPWISEPIPEIGGNSSFVELTLLEVDELLSNDWLAMLASASPDFASTMNLVQIVHKVTLVLWVVGIAGCIVVIAKRVASLVPVDNVRSIATKIPKVACMAAGGATLLAGLIWSITANVAAGQLGGLIEVPVAPYITCIAGIGVLALSLLADRQHA